MSYTLDEIHHALKQIKAYRSDATMVIDVLKQTVKSTDEISICEIIDGIRMMHKSNWFTIELLYQLDTNTSPTLK
jgi:hypothetical protein